MRAFDKKPLQDDKVQKSTPQKPVTGAPNRHQQILQMQRQYGNQAVRRMIQRQVALGEIDSTVAEDEGSSTTSIGDGTASVTAQNGSVEITAASVNIDAPITYHRGVDESDTVVTDTVVATNYTPGAGNIF